MGSKIEVRFHEYGHMSLICDDDALARLREYICNETSVAAALGGASEPSRARFISIRPPVEEPARPRLHWYQIIPIALVNCVMIPAWIVGLVTI
jgi:hypothetical protein